MSDPEDKKLPKDPQAVEGSSNRSQMSKDLEALRRTILDAAAKRGRLPQPLFWSLFNSRLKTIKDAKLLRRMMDELLGS